MRVSTFISLLFIILWGLLGSCKQASKADSPNPGDSEEKMISGASLNLTSIQYDQWEAFGDFLDAEVALLTKDDLTPAKRDFFEDFIMLDSLRKELYATFDLLINQLSEPDFGNKNGFKLVLTRPESRELAHLFWFSKQFRVLDSGTNATIFRQAHSLFFEHLIDHLMGEGLGDKTISTIPWWYKEPKQNLIVPASKYKDYAYADYVFDEISIEESMQLILSVGWAATTWEMSYLYLLQHP